MVRFVAEINRVMIPGGDLRLMRTGGDAHRENVLVGTLLGGLVAGWLPGFVLQFDYGVCRVAGSG